MRHTRIAVFTESYARRVAVLLILVSEVVDSPERVASDVHLIDREEMRIAYPRRRGGA